MGKPNTSRAVVNIEPLAKRLAHKWIVSRSHYPYDNYYDFASSLTQSISPSLLVSSICHYWQQRFLLSCPGCYIKVALLQTLAPFAIFFSFSPPAAPFWRLFPPMSIPFLSQQWPSLHCFKEHPCADDCKSPFMFPVFLSVPFIPLFSSLLFSRHSSLNSRPQLSAACWVSPSSQPTTYQIRLLSPIKDLLPSALQPFFAENDLPIFLAMLKYWNLPLIFPSFLFLHIDPTSRFYSFFLAKVSASPTTQGHSLT